MINKKICNQCKIAKPLDEYSFHNKSAGLRHPWCQSCFHVYRQQYKINRPEDYRNRSLKDRQTNWIKDRVSGLFQKVTGNSRMAQSGYMAIVEYITNNQSDCCRYCGQRLLYGLHGTAHLDHILCQSRHPEFALEPANLQWICDFCNNAKRNLDESDFIKKCKAVAAHS